MKIIGLTSHISGNHDNSACLLKDGEIVFAEGEERPSRRKHDKHFPIKVIKEILKRHKLTLKKIDYFATAAIPLSLRGFLITYIKGFFYTKPRKVIQWLLVRAWLVLRGKELHKKDNLPNSLQEMRVKEEKLIKISHYLAHAETAYMYGGMDNCIVVAWDGYGVDKNGFPLSGTVFRGEKGELTKLEDVPVFSSLALYYGAVTVALGFKLNDGEGKTMGLAVYGKRSGVVKKIRDFFPNFENGKWKPKPNWLEVNGVSRPAYFRLTPSYRYLRLLVEKYGSEQVAYAVQQVLEEEGTKYFKYLSKKYQSNNFAVAGGIFLNVKFNMKLLERGIAKKLFIYPNAGDGGVAVGAAIAAYKQLGNKVPVIKMESASLGCDFTKTEISKTLKRYGGRIEYKDYKEKISKVAAKQIINGKVIGWFQGRGEWGPRALGNRSVLADPRKLEIKDRINDKLKQRDWFMPFAPVIQEEYVDKVLVNSYITPFMTLTDSVRPSFAKKIPGAIHIDNTARGQFIKKTVNFRYWSVINEFRKATGVPVLLNTSFNKHGLPIVHKPEEAVDHLLWGCIDELVIDTLLVKRVRSDKSNK